VHDGRILIRILRQWSFCVPQKKIDRYLHINVTENAVDKLLCSFLKHVNNEDGQRVLDENVHYCSSITDFAHRRRRKNTKRDKPLMWVNGKRTMTIDRRRRYIIHGV